MLITDFKVPIHIEIKILCGYLNELIKKMRLRFDIDLEISTKMLEIVIKTTIYSQKLKIHTQFNKDFSLFIAILQNRG